jgi:hypothetical protein
MPNDVEARLLRDGESWQREFDDAHNVQHVRTVSARERLSGEQPTRAGGRWKTRVAIVGTAASVVAVAIVVTALVRGGGTTDSATSQTSTAAASETPTILPAAGPVPTAHAKTCYGASSGATVIRVEPDGLVPYCQAVTGSATLTILNASTDYGQPGASLMVALPGFESQVIAPGESITTGRASQFLAPGVHFIQVQLSGRQSVWLEIDYN